MMFTSASARESERDAAASPSSITHQEASYAAASIIESTSDGLLIFTFMSQPSAKADSFTIPGVSAKFSLISMTSPLIGEYTSDAALTLSTTPNEPLASTELPTSGSSTYTMSPNSAYSTGDSSVIRIDENDEIAPRARAHSRLVLSAPPLSRASFASLSRAIREAPKTGRIARSRAHLRVVRDTDGGDVAIHLGPLVRGHVLQALDHCARRSPSVSLSSRLVDARVRVVGASTGERRRLESTVRARRDGTSPR